EADPVTLRRVRLLLSWLVTAFVLIAVSGRQRDRYYVALCPAAALLIGWSYSTLAWRWRARAFAGACIAVVAGGVVFVTLDTPRFNATTDLTSCGPCWHGRRPTSSRMICKTSPSPSTWTAQS